jgi:hypothetical protein
MGDITPEWTAIANRPTTFTPSAHTHPQSEITNLVSDLASKADAAATTSALAGKAASIHGHAQSDVTGLVSDLANKRTILSGTTVPSAGLGSDGDLYIDTLGNRLYGPKSAGSWGSGSFTKGDPGTGATAVIRSSNFTAATGVRYITTQTLTITDPGTATLGDNYEVMIGAGTCTIGGVAFAPSRIEVIRYFNGTNWQTLNATITGSLTSGNYVTSGSSLFVQDVVSVALVSNALALPSNANVIYLTGTGPLSTITGGTIGATYRVQNKTAGSLTITHGASTLVCRGGANITLGVDQIAQLLCETTTKASVL